MRRLLMLALVALALPAAGTAAFPGTNGRLLFTQVEESIDRFDGPRVHLCASPPTGERPTKIAEPAEGLGQWIEHPAMTATGDALAYSRGNQLFVAAPDGSGERLLADGTMPSWMPDGRTLYFTTRTGDIYSIRPDGSELTPFVASTRYEQMPTVSPDGSKVV
jgi:hypothetical protein